jgi:hypothetical protein
MSAWKCERCGVRFDYEPIELWVNIVQAGSVPDDAFAIVDLCVACATEIKAILRKASMRRAAEMVEGVFRDRSTHAL